METQGHKKIGQILSDLQKNNEFKEKLCEIKQEKNTRKIRELELRLCKDSGIDYGDLKYLLNDPHATDFTASIEMCVVGYAYPDDLLIKRFFPSAARSKGEIEAHKEAYPVSIDLHKFCTKNDLTDFIENYWKIIESHLMWYRGKKKKIIRTRPNAERDDFMYQQKEQGKTTKEIKQLVKEKFETIIMPEEINTVLRLERKRRNKNLVTPT